MLLLGCADATDLFSRIASVGFEDLADDEVPLLVVRGDGPDWSALDAHSLASIDTDLRAVTLAVVDGDPPPPDHPAKAFDVVLGAGVAGDDGAGGCAVFSAEIDTDIARLAETVGRSPQASVALAQLLRMDLSGDVGAGLVGESLTYSMLQSGPEFARWFAERATGDRPSAVIETDSPVVLGRVGDRHTITLNRPHRANAVSASLRDHLVAALESVSAEGDDLSIELRAAGPNFCSGGDLGEFGTFPDPATAHHVRTTRSPARWAARLAQRLEAHIHGVCAGAGIELPAFAHRIVAAPNTDIWLPELGLGLIPGAGGTVSLPRRIGRHRTAWLGLTGQHIGAETAKSWGLVDEIADPTADRD